MRFIGMVILARHAAGEVSLFIQFSKATNFIKYSTVLRILTDYSDLDLDYFRNLLGISVELWVDVL
jgi:hypothetical protein